MQYSQREHFWNTLIWPVLWPLLLVQAALVVLCALVVWLVGWVSPGYASWSISLWLMLVLLIGSSLNVAAFLMLVKSRAKHKEERLMQQLVELEQHTKTLTKRVAITSPRQTLTLDELSDERPIARLADVNSVLSSLAASIAAPSSAEAVANETDDAKTLLDDLHHQQQQVRHLLAGRDRAREESRLKSEYLGLLQRETDALFDRLSEQLNTQVSEDCRANMLEVRERIADIRALLMNLVQHRDVPAESSDQAPVASSLRVLVVDDGPVNLMLARQMLENHGLYVEGVSSGEQALERQQQSFFDLVFMDIFMPTLNGLETTRRWREVEAAQGGRKSVLVALTANADNMGQQECLSAGLDDLLTKPYQPETLLGIITTWFPEANGASPTR
ncbi:response regulator [Halomonas sp. HL-93]|uniref:response regulator n=1 Tax=Halomonas sp. HL-93 TaxID=1666906 RepID=UPI0006DA0CEA|nr:response regulator [Halomonas sp. HL-93]KPQ22482.1 MAG: CheY-like receiver protein [Halomonas sp. HL-93]SBR49947.1 CheY chemotaxis protein or a CheY-like REC (receiver) domain [Halomonas sp. HL-93]